MTKGQKESSESLRKLETDSEKTRKSIDSDSKKMGESLYKLRNQVVALMTAFTAGAGIKSFYQSITASDASTGRLANNINTSVENLSAWQAVAERSGGSAEGIAGTMRELTNQFQQLALTGQSGVIPYFRAVGVAISDAEGKMRPLNDILLDVAEKFHAMNDPAKAQALGRGMGIDEGTVNVLLKGREAIQQLLREQERLGRANKQDTDAAIRREAAWKRLVQISEDLGRKFLTELTPAIEAVAGWLERVGLWFQEHPEAARITIGALTTAVAALSAAISVGLVGALGSAGIAGVAAFGGILAAAGPVAAAIAAIAGAGYGTKKGLDWLKSRKGFRTRDFSAPDAWEEDSQVNNAPRGIRNNNPGNLKYAGQAGATKESGENGYFAVFGSMEEGIKALARQLQLYSERGLDTIREIIGTYAPATENDTTGYIAAVARAMGIDPDAKLNLKDRDVLKSMIESITTQEVGKGFVSPSLIDGALSSRGGRNSYNNRSEVQIGKIEVHTRATDAKGIAGGIGDAIGENQQIAAMANYGLS